MKRARIAIIGGGIYGLCTAFALLQRGYSSITIFEKGTWPNRNASSHGHTRITRSAYSSSFYVHLMQEAHNQYWPALSNALGMQLLYPCHGIFFGPEDGIIQRYYSAVQEAGASVKLISNSIASSQFPQFLFQSNDMVLLDETSAVIAAQQTIFGLLKYLNANNVALHPQAQVEEVRKNTIVIDGKENYFDQIVCCAGPWIPKLLPELGDILRPHRQRVFYMEAHAKYEISIPHFPVWLEVGYSLDDSWYGLPQFGQKGFKIAHHRLDGTVDDPDAVSIIQDEHRKDVQNKILNRLPAGTGRILTEELCIYTMKEQEDFLIDRLKNNPHVVVAGGFSGHGFKLAPRCADIIVDALEEKPVPSRFTLASYLKEHDVTSGSIF